MPSGQPDPEPAGGPYAVRRYYQTPAGYVPDLFVPAAPGEAPRTGFKYVGAIQAAKALLRYPWGAEITEVVDAEGYPRARYWIEDRVVGYSGGRSVRSLAVSRFQGGMSRGLANLSDPMSRVRLIRRNDKGILLILPLEIPPSGSEIVSAEHGVDIPQLAFSMPPSKGDVRIQAFRGMWSAEFLPAPVTSSTASVPPVESP